MVHLLVSSNATSLPEIFGEAAYYFDPLDTEAMVKAIRAVLTRSDTRERLIDAGHKQVRKYSWKRMAEQTLDIYRQVLGEI